MTNSENTEVVERPETQLAVVIDRVVKDQDHDRLRAMCSLLNTFNYAVQVQSDRNAWEPEDFRAFAIALVAMDQIGLFDVTHEKVRMNKK